MCSLQLDWKVPKGTFSSKRLSNKISPHSNLENAEQEILKVAIV